MPDSDSHFEPPGLATGQTVLRAAAGIGVATVVSGIASAGSRTRNTEPAVTSTHWWTATGSEHT